jgi:hypothetical protein
VFLEGVYGVRYPDFGTGFCCGRAGRFFCKFFLKSFWKFFWRGKKFRKKFCADSMTRDGKVLKNICGEIFFKTEKFFMKIILVGRVREHASVLVLEVQSDQVTARGTKQLRYQAGTFVGAGQEFFPKTRAMPVSHRSRRTFITNPGRFRFCDYCPELLSCR